MGSRSIALFLISLAALAVTFGTAVIAVANTGA